MDLSVGFMGDNPEENFLNSGFHSGNEEFSTPLPLRSKISKKHSEHLSLLSPFTRTELKNMHNGLDEWQNIQPIFRDAFKKISSSLEGQKDFVKKIEMNLLDFQSNIDIIVDQSAAPTKEVMNKSLLSIKPIQDELNNLKLSRNDVADEVTHVSLHLSDLQDDFEEYKTEQAKECQQIWKEIRLMQKNMHDKADSKETEISLKSKVDISKLNELMDSEIRKNLSQKANIQWVANQLSLKANSTTVSSIRDDLNKKVDTSTLGEQLVTKINTESFEKYISKISSELDEKADATTTSKNFELVAESLSRKSDLNQIQLQLDTLNKHLLDSVNQTSLNKHIEYIKKELILKVDSANIALHKNVVEKLDTKVSMSDFVSLTESIGGLSKEIETKGNFEDIDAFKTEVKLLFEDCSTKSELKNLQQDINRLIETGVTNDVLSQIIMKVEDELNNVSNDADDLKESIENFKKNTQNDMIQVTNEAEEAIRISIETLRNELTVLVSETMVDIDEFNDYKLNQSQLMVSKANTAEIEGILNNIHELANGNKETIRMMGNQMTDVQKDLSSSIRVNQEESYVSNFNELHENYQSVSNRLNEMESEIRLNGNDNEEEAKNKNIIALFRNPSNVEFMIDQFIDSSALQHCLLKNCENNSLSIKNQLRLQIDDIQHQLKSKSEQIVSKMEELGLRLNSDIDKFNKKISNGQSLIRKFYDTIILDANKIPTTAISTSTSSTSSGTTSNFADNNRSSSSDNGPEFPVSHTVSKALIRLDTCEEKLMELTSTIKQCQESINLNNKDRNIMADNIENKMKELIRQKIDPGEVHNLINQNTSKLSNEMKILHREMMFLQERSKDVQQNNMNKLIAEGKDKRFNEEKSYANENNSKMPKEYSETRYKQNVEDTAVSGATNFSGLFLEGNSDKVGPYHSSSITHDGTTSTTTGTTANDNIIRRGTAKDDDRKNPSLHSADSFNSIVSSASKLDRIRTHGNYDRDIDDGKSISEYSVAKSVVSYKSKYSEISATSSRKAALAKELEGKSTKEKLRILRARSTST